MEKDLEAALVKAINKFKGLCIKLWPLSFSGLPDRMILLPGARIIFVETKFKGGQLRPRQVIVQRQLRDLGFRAENIKSTQELNEFIKQL